MDRRTDTPSEVKQSLHMIRMEMGQRDYIQASRRKTVIQIHQSGIEQNAGRGSFDQGAAGPPNGLWLRSSSLTRRASTPVKRNATGSTGAEEGHAHANALL